MSVDPAEPHDVAEEDVEWARPGGEPLLATVYRPARVDAPLPALVDVHGGAWNFFDRRVDAYYDRALAACGLVVIAIVRQAPAHRYPTAVADLVAAVRWTRANAARLAAAEPVGLIGGSSGGHLAMLAALRPHAPEFAATPVATDADPGVAYVLPLWPILDPLARYRYLLARRADPTPGRDPFFQPERLIAAHDAFFADEAEMQRASALRIVEAGEAETLPPIWIAHPELDENVTLAMTERFVAAYRAAGGAVELEVFPALGHGFANFPGAAADGCIRSMWSFISRRLAAADHGLGWSTRNP
ncbi:MAG TPA: alpha/beta hydrolase [Candidatus Binatia bacterium]|nr:alpha/beta hydrolase [Candidatus Binatia bacterium]